MKKRPYLFWYGRFAVCAHGSFLFSSWQHFEHSEQQPQQPFFRERIMYLTAHISRKIISPRAIQSAKFIVTPPYIARIRLPML